MKPHHIAFSPTLIAAVLVFAATPANASETAESADGARTPAIAAFVLAAAPEAASEAVVTSQPANPASPSSGPPPATVFDETWLTIGLGAGLTPSYAGSNDYIANPVPLIIGRVAGIGISPSGAGLVFDLNSRSPSAAPSKGVRVSFGPAFRLRNDRANRISDDVVARAGELDTALEVGAAAGVGFPGVLNRYDQLTIAVQARWDVLGAHDGMIIEPQIGYRTPLSRSIILQVQASAEFVDDSFADYYFAISPAQSAATGLPQFAAEGGLNRVGTTMILARDLDRDLQNGGLSVFGIGGYSRLMGDSADTPFTSVRGSADQFLAGLGLAYTF
jgi:outer membrane scaffolding protein for murein synthesis (MipA/OmpV family)